MEYFKRLRVYRPGHMVMHGGVLMLLGVLLGYATLLAGNEGMTVEQMTHAREVGRLFFVISAGMIIYGLMLKKGTGQRVISGFQVHVIEYHVDSKCGDAGRVILEKFLGYPDYKVETGL